MTSLRLKKTKSILVAWITEQTDNTDCKQMIGQRRVGKNSTVYRTAQHTEQHGIQNLWNLQGTNHFEQESVCDRIILKGILKIIWRCELDSSGSVHDLREGRCGQESDSQFVTEAHRARVCVCVSVRICACSIRSDIRNGSATGLHFAVLFTAVRPSVRTDVNGHSH